MEGKEVRLETKITTGVCVLEKKASSAPMLQILDRLQAFGEFEIVHFSDKQLKMYGVPIPRYALVNREFHNQELDYFVEVHWNWFWKPFVEKPVDGDDYSIMIYYPSAAGGGMKELFRKMCIVQEIISVKMGSNASKAAMNKAWNMKS